MSTTGGVGQLPVFAWDWGEEGVGTGGGGGQGLHDEWEKGMERVEITTPQTCLTFRQLKLPNPII